MLLEQAVGDHVLGDFCDNILANLGAVLGNEADKRRPAILVSNDRANLTAARLGRGVMTVVPVTSNTGWAVTKRRLCARLVLSMDATQSAKCNARNPPDAAIQPR